MKKFIKYSVYAFGLPTVIVLIVATLNELQIVPTDWQTGIGNYSCSVSEPLNGGSEELLTITSRSQLIYIYGPIMVFLVMNFGFYATTAFTINKVQRDVRKFTEGERSKHARKESTRFTRYARLFLMMGLPWVIEIVSFLVGENPFMYLVSIINCLQGLIIFNMFVLHETTVDVIWKK
jgi:G protein-coupled receptor Mth (Methuselah protein)